MEATHRRKLSQAKGRRTVTKLVGKETVCVYACSCGCVHMHEQACGSHKSTLDELITLDLIILDSVSQ